MKRAPLWALALSASLISPLASAGSDTGFYLGGAIGTSDISESWLDDTDTGYKVFAGYNFGVLPFLNLAAEASYVDLGEWRDSGVRAETDAWALAAVAGFDLGPVGIFVKAGQANWDVDSNVGSDDGTDRMYGLGGKFQLFSIALRVEYERFELDDADADFYSVGAVFTF